MAQVQVCIRLGRRRDGSSVYAMSLLLFLSGLLPVFGFFSQNFRGRFRAMLRKMTILMTYFALEG
jgi:hypothetical protein